MTLDQAIADLQAAKAAGAPGDAVFHAKSNASPPVDLGQIMSFEFDLEGTVAGVSGEVAINKNIVFAQLA